MNGKLEAAIAHEIELNEVDESISEFISAKRKLGRPKGWRSPSPIFKCGHPKSAENKKDLRNGLSRCRICFNARRNKRRKENPRSPVRGKTWQAMNAISNAETLAEAKEIAISWLQDHEKVGRPRKKPPQVD